MYMCTTLIFKSQFNFVWNTRYLIFIFFLNRKGIVFTVKDFIPTLSFIFGLGRFSSVFHNIQIMLVNHSLT